MGSRGDEKMPSESVKCIIYDMKEGKKEKTEVWTCYQEDEGYRCKEKTSGIRSTFGKITSALGSVIGSGVEKVGKLAEHVFSDATGDDVCKKLAERQGKSHWETS